MEQEKTLVQENKMGVMNENKLLITMALPLIISMLVQACYNIVDSIFVAMVSEDALTLTAGTYRHPKKPEDLVERNLEEERGK